MADGDTARAVRIDPRERGRERERDSRWTLRGVPLFARVTSSVLGARILRLPRFSEASRRAGPRRIFLLFVRFIARSLCLPSFFSFFSSPPFLPPSPTVFPRASNAVLTRRRMYSSQNSMTRIRESKIPETRGVNDRRRVDSEDDRTALARTVGFVQSTSPSMATNTLLLSRRVPSSPRCARNVVGLTRREIVAATSAGRLSRWNLVR